MEERRRWAARSLGELPEVPAEAPFDPVWHPLQHAFGLSAFGANVFVARRGDEVLVEEHDEAGSGQEELYLVLEGEVAFTVDGEAFAARRGTAVAVLEPSVRRSAVARSAGAALLAVGTRPGCFATTWRESYFSGVPRVPPGAPEPSPPPREAGSPPPG
jgi:quercetin dioxygenase-like cupin family protein